MKNLTLIFVLLLITACSDNPTGADTDYMKATVDRVEQGYDYVISFLEFEDGAIRGYSHFFGPVGTQLECEIIDGKKPDSPQQCS